MSDVKPYTPQELDERFAIRRVADLRQPLTIYAFEVERMIETARLVPAPAKVKP